MRATAASSASPAYTRRRRSWDMYALLARELRPEIVSFRLDREQRFAHITGGEAAQEQLPDVAHERGRQRHDDCERKRKEDERVDIGTLLQLVPADRGADQEQQERGKRDEVESLVEKAHRRWHLALRRRGPRPLP